MPGLLSSDTPQGTGTGDKEPLKQPSADEINDFLGADDDKSDKTDKTDKDDKDDKDDKEDEPARRRKSADKDDKDDDKDEDQLSVLKDDDDEDKIDLEDEDDPDKKKLKVDGDEDFEIDAPPKKKEILAKYPKLFKEFPHLEKMMYRDRQYTELFGSFDDAKEAASQVQVLARFEADLSEGNTTTVLKQIKETDKVAYDKIVDNYLEALGSVDKDAQAEVIGNVAKNFIAAMVRNAKKIEGSNADGAKALKQAALVLNQWMFGTDEWTAPQPRVVRNEADDAVKREQQQYVAQRFTDSQNELQGKVDNILKATINEYIDRNNEMTAFEKKHAVASALKNLHKSIGNDASFRKSLDRLWEAAYSDRFSRNSLDRIKSAYLGRSKQVLKTVIKNARAEALKDKTPSSRKNDEDREEERDERPRRTITSGRPRQSEGGKRNEMRKGESVAEFLARD